MKQATVHEVIALPVKTPYSDDIRMIMQSQHMIRLFLSLPVTRLDMQQHLSIWLSNSQNYNTSKKL